MNRRRESHGRDKVVTRRRDTLSQIGLWSLTVSCAVIAAAGHITAAADQKRDFSGRWIVTGPADSGSDPVRPLIVRQDANALTVEDWRTGRGAVVYTLFATQADAEANSRLGAKAWWSGDRIVASSTLRARNGRSIEHTKTWTLDAYGMLHIEIVERRGPRAARSVEHYLFRRDDPNTEAPRIVRGQYRLAPRGFAVNVPRYAVGLLEGPRKSSVASGLRFCPAVALQCTRT